MNALRSIRPRAPNRLACVLAMGMLLIAGLNRDARGEMVRVPGPQTPLVQESRRVNADENVPIPSAAVMGMALLGTLVAWRSVHHWRKMRR